MGLFVDVRFKNLRTDMLGDKGEPLLGNYCGSGFTGGVKGELR